MKSAAVDQALATRKARNTMGSQQKKKVKGVVPAAAAAAAASEVTAQAVKPAPVPLVVAPEGMVNGTAPATAAAVVAKTAN